MHRPTIDAPTPEDAAAVTALMNRADEREIGRPDANEEEVSASWREPGFVLATDAWVLRGDDHLAGYAELTVRAAGRDFDADHRVDPEHEAPEHHTRLIEAMLRRAGALATSPEAMISEYAPRDALARRSALEQLGFRPERVVHRMSIELTEAPGEPRWPADVHVRSMAAPEDEHAVHAVIQSAFVDHYRFEPEAFEPWLERQRNHPRYDPQLFRVAWRHGEPIAAIEALDVEDLAWIPRLGVVRSARGEGLGRALLLETFRAFWARGQRRVELGVDTENTTGATQLYESVGMRVEACYDLFRRRVRSE